MIIIDTKPSDLYERLKKEAEKNGNKKIILSIDAAYELTFRDEIKDTVKTTENSDLIFNSKAYLVPGTLFGLHVFIDESMKGDFKVS